MSSTTDPASPATPAVAPAIYVRVEPSPRAPWQARLIALLVAAAAAWVLIVAVRLEPDARGVSTHTQLGLQPCSFLERTGIPCAGCGMTTSFAYLVRGNVVQSFIAQPFGLILCVLTAAAFWAGLYLAVSGKPAYRLLYLIPAKVHLLTWIPLAAIGWLWKIALMTLGY